MTQGRRIARNVLTNYVVIAGQLGVAFLLTPFLIGTLGDERYGLWSIITAFTAYLTLLDLGIVSAITKFLSQHRAEGDGKRIDTMLGSAMAIVLPISAGLIALSPFLGEIVVAVVKVSPELEGILRLAVLLSTLEIAVFVFAGVYRGVVFGTQRHDLSNALVLASLGAKATAFYFALSNGFGLVAMSAIALVSSVLLAVGYVLLARRVAPDASANPRGARRETVRELQRYSAATFMSMIAGQLIYYSDAFVIGHALSAAAVAFYSVAWSLAEYVNRLMVVASRVFIPVFSVAVASGSGETVFLLYRKAIRYQLVVSNLFCVGMLVLGDQFVWIWIGPEYAEVCRPLIIILFATQLFRGPQLISYSLLQGMGAHKRYSRINLGFALANLALSLVMVRLFGLVGVAAATAATQIVFHGLVVPQLALGAIDQSLGSFLRHACLPTVPPAVLLAIVLFVLDAFSPARGYLSLLFQAFVGAAVYFAAVALLVLDRDELGRLRRAASRRLRVRAAGRQDQIR